MPLFQKSVLNKYLKEQDKYAVHSAHEIYYSYIQNPQIQQNIHDSKAIAVIELKSTKTKDISNELENINYK